MINIPEQTANLVLNSNRVDVSWGLCGVEFEKDEPLSDTPEGITESDVLRFLILMAARKAGALTMDQVRSDPSVRAFFDANLANIRQAVVA